MAQLFKLLKYLDDLIYPQNFGIGTPLQKYVFAFTTSKTSTKKIQHTPFPESTKSRDFFAASMVGSRPHQLTKSRGYANRSPLSPQIWPLWGLPEARFTSKVCRGMDPKKSDSDLCNFVQVVDVWQQTNWEVLPSGKHTQNYGKSQFSIDKSTINGNFQ